MRGALQDDEVLGAMIVVMLCLFFSSFDSGALDLKTLLLSAAVGVAMIAPSLLKPRIARARAWRAHRRTIRQAAKRLPRATIHRR